MTKNNDSIRPWGHYDILLEDSSCKVKKITVIPGGRLSYQKHFKRSETWVVVSGTGVFTLDGVDQPIKKGSVLYIPVESAHRIHNTDTKIDLVFIEVQQGSYFGEDDIVRLADDYGR